MRVLTRSYESFYSCAIFLTFSLQIAAMVILVQTNFGSSTVGAYTLQTTWSVSLLCLLPLMYGTFMPELFEEQHNGMELHPEQSTSSEEKQREMRATLRFWLYHLCWMLSIYPFGSSLLNTFGPSQIGNHPESAISDKDWNKIASVCLSGVDQISRAENVAMRGLLLSTWLFVYLATIGRLVILALKPHYRHHAITKRLKRLWPQSVRPLHTQVVFLISVTLLGGGQFWTYLRLHRAQMQMSAAAGNPDMDEQWSFGQIVAVSVFAPVLVEAMFATRVSALPDCGTSTTTLSTSAEEFRPSKAK